MTTCSFVIVSSEREDDTYVPGVLRTLTSLFKHAKRDDVVGVAPAVLRRLCRGDLQMTFNIQQRKSFIKLVQWVGVVFLPPRIAKWRYQRGGRSLEEALGSTHTTPLQTEFPTEVRNVGGAVGVKWEGLVDMRVWRRRRPRKTMKMGVVTTSQQRWRRY